MSQKIVKLGVVGMGRGARMAALVANDDNVRIRAICDMDDEKLRGAKALLEGHGVHDLQCYENYEKMLQKADIDAVYVCSFAVNHVPLAIQALEKGKHVLCEIPPISTLEEAKQLKAAVLAHPELKFMVGENCCYWAFIETWKHMYDEGKFGDIAYAESEYLHGRDWRQMKPEDYPADHWRQYNPAIKYLTHNLGPLLYIMDDRCVSVSCMVPDVKYNPYREGQKNGVALFRTAKGAVIRILICFDAYVGFDHNFAMIGTRGSIHTDKNTVVDNAHSFARLSDIPGSIDELIDIPVTTRYHGESGAGHGGADGKMMRHFIRCIIDDTKPPIDIDLGIRMTLPGIIAHESALQGGALLEIPEI